MTTIGTNGPALTHSSDAVHDKDMARRFLAGLDPSATRFTFQLFNDRGSGRAQIIHGTLDEVWPKVQPLNTAQQGVGVFVVIAETDFKGRKAENIVRARALFVDADGREQVQHCTSVLNACGVYPSMAVNSGRGCHFYFCTDVAPNQFSELQKLLITRLGTDKAVKDLSRVMRLPGTLHLKDPDHPRLVKLLIPQEHPVQRWQLPDLISKLGLSPSPATPEDNVVPFKAREWAIEGRPSAFFAQLRTPIESLTEGLDTNTEEIRSAVMAIPPSVIADEGNWMRLARGLAHEGRVFKKEKEMWEILDAASRRADNYDEEDNRRRFQRYMNEALDREDPISVYTVFRMATQHGWHSWSPPIAPTGSETLVWRAGDLNVSFANVSHRRWLYGTYLIRGEITVLAAPGGAGKTALATGIAVEIAAGVSLLGENIFGSELKVLFINGEDGGTEIRRRIWALCLARSNELGGQNLDRLCIAGADDARVQRLSFLRTTERNAFGARQKRLRGSRVCSRVAAP